MEDSFCIVLGLAMVLGLDWLVIWFSRQASVVLGSFWLLDDPDIYHDGWQTDYQDRMYKKSSYASCWGGWAACIFNEVPVDD